MELDDAKLVIDKLNREALAALDKVHEHYADSMRETMIIFQRRCIASTEPAKLAKYIEQNLISWPHKSHKDHK